MRIAVVGTGGVGAYFGGRLAQVGEDVIFVARGAHLKAIQESGLRVDSPDGDFIIHPAQATDDTTTVGPVDVVLLAVKGWQVPDAVETTRPLMGRDTFIVSLLNGVEAPDQLAAAFGEQHVVGGLCGLFGSVVGPGHIRNVMARPFVAVGELDNSRTGRIERLHQAFERAGVRSEITADIRAALWEKLLFVGPFGAVGAATRAPIGVVRSLAETRAMLEGAMAEISRLAQAHDVNVAADAIAKALAMVDSSPEQATASMQRDIVAGRPSELESQVGVVVRKALERGIMVPIHTCLYASLLPQERRARGEIVFPA
ncbi:MAG TPA: 2-dehydropantoate 2-reductase [Ktedonobacterales bacterium]|nr:2-dehydropantoate 2-reductase [Ktedonobacterales bacterium]